MTSKAVQIYLVMSDSGQDSENFSHENFQCTRFLLLFPLAAISSLYYFLKKGNIYWDIDRRTDTTWLCTPRYTQVSIKSLHASWYQVHILKNNRLAQWSIISKLFHEKWGLTDWNELVAKMEALSPVAGVMNFWQWCRYWLLWQWWRCSASYNGGNKVLAAAMVVMEVLATRVAIEVLTRVVVKVLPVFH